ncbi:MAG: hypothetical protein EZS28_027053 [Streblomastix strix]|uniref:Uncharacterized protein n=1 Tax=Streblomastix strix TaxID=222440 RepID=A0A5J4V529_9EUKA|nr:MAG: hypothetical protein EZS28_027053 [Streblomastix strix]
MSQAEETISQMKKRIIELEQKNKLNQNTILALEEQRNARGQLFDEQSRKLVDGERNKLLLELEEMKTASNKEILELRQANEDVKKALNKEIAAHNTTRENYLEQNNRAERLGQAQRQAQSEKMAADERARRNAQESMEAQSALSRLTDQMNDLQKDNQTLKMQLENTLAKTAEHEVRGETRIQLISKVRELQTEIDRVQNFKNDAILQIQSLRLERDRETERANLASSEREKQQDELRIAREGQQRITLQFRERESVLAEMQRRYEQLMEESIRMREEKEREQNAYTATLQNLQAKASEQLVSKDNIIDKLRQEIVELRKNSETTSKSKEKEFKVQNQQRIKEIKEEHNREIIQLHKIMEEKEKEYHDKEAEKKQSYEKLIFTKNEEIKRITTINEREITRLRDETKKREDELHTELQQLKEEKERERDSLIKEKQNELSEMQQRTSAECAASIQRESAVRQECEQKIRTADLQRAEEMRRNSEEERVKYETIIKDVQAQSAQAIEDAQQLKEEVEQLREVVREAEHKALMEKESALEQQRSQWTTQFQEMIEKHQSEKEDIEKEHQQREAVTQRRLTTEKKKATDALQERLEAVEKEKDQAATKLRQFEAVHGQEKRRAVSDVEKKWKDKTEAIEQKYKDELQQTQEQLKQYQKKIQELNAAQKENKQREDEMTELSEKQNTEWREALQEREQQLQRQEQRFEKEKQIQSAIHMQQLEQKDSEIRLLQDTLRRHEDQLTVGAKDREAIMSELRGNIDAERDQHERLMSQVKQQAALEQKLRDDSILQLKQQIDENHSEKDILLKQAVILRQQLDIARAQLGGVARLGLSIPSINATSTFTGYQNNSGSSDGVFNSIQENDQNQFTVNSTWFPPNSRSPSVRLSPTQSVWALHTTLNLLNRPKHKHLHKCKEQQKLQILLITHVYYMNKDQKRWKIY